MLSKVDEVELRKEAEEMLRCVILPFWHSMRDDRNGGFFGYIGSDLARDESSDKGVILMSRILWFFSEAAILLRSEKERNAAEHAYRFLSERAIDREHGGVYWSLSYDGKPSDTSKHVYCQAFAVYALSSYYRLTGDEKALGEAFSIYSLLESSCRDGIGYLENFHCDWTPDPDNSRLSGHGVNAYRTMNTLLHIFEAYSGLYQATGSQKVASSMRRILGIYLDRVYSPEKRREEVFFDRNYVSLLDITSYGHDIESSWLIEWGASLLEDAELSSRVSVASSAMAWNVYEEAYDARGFIANEKYGDSIDRSRIWWVEAEAVEGFLNEYRKSGNEKCKEAAVSIWRYIKEHFVDRRNGSEWFWAVGDGDEPVYSYPIADPWKCPYHNGRLCMNLMRGEL